MAKKRRTKKQKRRQRRRVVLLVIAVIALVVAAAVLAIRYIFPSAEPWTPGTSFSDPTEGEEDAVNIDTLNELRASGDLYSILESWAKNNTGNSLMHDKNVINLLVVGLDASKKNSDTIMLVSVNKNAGDIHLASIMRDSYTYMDTPVGEAAAKINAAYANGGIDCLIDTVENDYKIKIDHYVGVDFNTFVDVVDLIGGVRVPVQEYERRAMNGLAVSESERLYESGDSVLLNGKQALLYCRIRKCDVDGDVSRTRRQRQFVSALIDAAGELNASDLPDLARTLHKYIVTDCSAGELISLGTQALKNKWYQYPVTSVSFPLPENRLDYSGMAWVWIVDYPADAQAMQMMLYGKTNITLSDDRQTAIDLMRGY